jgi:hypothetical protein
LCESSTPTTSDNDGTNQAYKVDTNGANVAFRVRIVGKTQQQAGFPDARVANKQQLEQVVAVLCVRCVAIQAAAARKTASRVNAHLWQSRVGYGGVHSAGQQEATRRERTILGSFAVRFVESRSLASVGFGSFGAIACDCDSLFILIDLIFNIDLWIESNQIRIKAHLLYCFASTRHLGKSKIYNNEFKQPPKAHSECYPSLLCGT